MFRKRYLIIIVLFISIHSYSQTSAPGNKTKPANSGKNKREFGFPFPEVGYIWQGYNNIEAGIKLPYFTYFLNKTRPHENISIIAGSTFFKYNVTYASPFGTLKYYVPVNKTIIALNFSGTYSFTKVEGVSDQRITPEIGIAAGVFSISYGYNIPVGVGKIPFMSVNRIAFRWIPF